MQKIFLDSFNRIDSVELAKHSVVDCQPAASNQITASSLPQDLLVGQPR